MPFLSPEICIKLLTLQIKILKTSTQSENKYEQKAEHSLVQSGGMLRTNHGIGFAIVLFWKKIQCK